MRKALEESQRVLGGAHPVTLTSINNFATLLQDQGKLGEAEPLFREALGGFRRLLGDSHPSALVSINSMASLLWSQGKLGEAEQLYRETLAVKRRTLGDSHPETIAHRDRVWVAIFFRFLLKPLPPHRRFCSCRACSLGFGLIQARQMKDTKKQRYMKTTSPPQPHPPYPLKTATSSS